MRDYAGMLETSRAGVFEADRFDSWVLAQVLEEVLPPGGFCFGPAVLRSRGRDLFQIV
jgi:hypothetical protein